MTTAENTPPTGQSGFTMVEVLVTLVVFSIGLVGFASLQMNSLQVNHVALMRSMATIQAQDLADRMRANRAGVTQGHYDDPSAAAHTDCTTTAGCNPAELAENDVYEWNQTLADDLPDGQGFVCVDSTPDASVNPAAGPACDGAGSLHTIYVTWTETVKGGAATRTFSVSIKP
ncbi:MAG TPA: type IV pilus modification protein PilV [Gammaproteobacteria bacterium]|nr:type IV pilus modification protein PilV [Gammaproteobacteria bacterium]